MTKGLLALLGLAAIGGVALVIASKDDDEQPATGPLPPPPSPADTPTTLPPIVPLPGGMNFPTTLEGITPPPIPPVEYPIPGGTYIENVGWCPPGFAYNLATKLCEWQDFQGPQHQPGPQTAGCKDCRHE